VTIFNNSRQLQIAAPMDSPHKRCRIFYPDTGIPSNSITQFFRFFIVMKNPVSGKGLIVKNDFLP
jgi:hypothetical protein